jgi:uncharacterized membrane protein
MTYTYNEIFFSEFFSTLGNMSAYIVSTTVAIPVLAFYSKKIREILTVNNKTD